MKRNAAFVLAALAVSASAALAQPTTPAAQVPIATYNPTAPASDRRPYFGDLHLHTTMSFDAWTFGTTTTPDQAYKFARGEPVTVLGKEARRGWPLDFLAVTDHSEAMGVFNQLDDPTNPITQTDIGKQILAKRSNAFYLIARAQQTGNLPAAQLNLPQAMKNAWDVEMKAANDNYMPGKFTTFIAYEWSSLNQGKYNLHRNVIFNADHAPLPFSSAQSTKPEDLWTYLESVRARGIDVIAIPHNGNVSGGLMFDWNDSSGKPIDQVYAQRRALNEPLFEITQNKGQSDTSPTISPNDEFANFEIFDHLLTWPNIKSQPHGSYVREAFGHGLVIESKVGTNPFKYGVVGATDIHNGLSTSDESAFAGGTRGIDPKTMLPGTEAAKRALGITKEPAALDMNAFVNGAKPTMEDALVFSSGGLTGVWAEENTRPSIFAALKRKETWATSGSRIRLRVFGGWKFDAQMMTNGSWTALAYHDGVPMGADLPARPATGLAPQFALWALKDPDGANLDRIQVIKIWLEGSDYREKIFDAAWSDHRRPKNGVLPLVGNTVDLKTGAYRNTVGATALSAVWQDPEFDPAKPAVYYARVLEIPTPRWSTLLAIKEHLPIPKGAAATIQERAWSSPIWFTPAKS